MKSEQARRGGNMEIKIKKIGYNRGTVGWLAAGLADGKITIEEGKSKSGKLGLYMGYDGDKYMLLGIYNPYDLTSGELNGNKQFVALTINGHQDDPGNICDRIGLTDAAKTALHDIASAWADNRNDERAADEMVSVKVTFVSDSCCGMTGEQILKGE